jgi:hypothetical protein
VHTLALRGNGVRDGHINICPLHRLGHGLAAGNESAGAGGAEKQFVGAYRTLRRGTNRIICINVYHIARHCRKAISLIFAQTLLSFFITNQSSATIYINIHRRGKGYKKFTKKKLAPSRGVYYIIEKTN